MKGSPAVIGVMTLMFFSCHQQHNAAGAEEKVLHLNNIVDLTHTLTDKFPFIPVKELT